MQLRNLLKEAKLSTKFWKVRQISMTIYWNKIQEKDFSCKLCLKHFDVSQIDFK